MRTFVVSLCALCLLGVATAAQAGTATPTEGTWSATTSAGLPITFEVNAGQIVNARFKFRWGFCGVFEGGAKNSVPIEPTGHWKFPDLRGPWIEGDFLEPDSAQGQVVAPSRMLPGCPETKANFIATPGPDLLPEKPPEVRPTKVRAARSIANDQLATRPHKITLSADGSFYLYKIHWKSFGSDEARAVGRAYLRNGCSTCPNKEVERPPVGIRLVHLVDQGNFRIYEHLSYVLQGTVPKSFEHRGAQSML
ncbi:MAG TPA: hypothetical protein VF081_09905 [Solirubrobacterales bacterium]